MIIECDSCEVRGHACGDCVIGVLLGTPSPLAFENDDPESPSGAPTVQLDAPERRALDVLAEQGLVPRLRLVATRPRQVPADENGERSIRGRRVTKQRHETVSGPDAPPERDASGGDAPGRGDVDGAWRSP